MSVSHSVSFRLLSVLIATTISVLAFGQTNKQRFDPNGSFWIHGTPPDEFKDLSAINLNARGNPRLDRPGVRLTTGRLFRFKLLKVTRNSFTFTTETVGGVSFGFAGRFLKGGVFAAANLDEKTPVLEGTLTKYRAGKKIAEAQLKFTYFGGT
jgi:hypothetical protein